jgi:hypothetical protein
MHDYGKLPLGTVMMLSRVAQENADRAQQDMDLTTYGGVYYHQARADKLRYESERDDIDSEIERRFARTDALVEASRREDLS